MKKIVASVSLVALGTAGLQAASSPSTDGKPWSVAATLSGFYDDNINSAPDNSSLAIKDNTGKTVTYHRGSAGFQVSPTISFAWPWEQTTFSASYTYAFKDYANKPLGNSDNYDQTHSFNVALDHSFNESYAVHGTDSFVVGQEPDFLRTGNALTTFSRISGNNIRNFGTVNLDGTLTPLMGFELGYANALYHYADDGENALDPNGAASTAGLLDRMEQTVHLDSRWQLQPETTGVLGYQFLDTDYTAGQAILPDGTMSDTRNSRSHYGYAGLDHQFLPDLTGAIRLGARYTDYYNDPNSSTSLSPYVQLSLRYAYGPESYVEGGFTQDRSATSLVGSSKKDLVLDAQTSNLYATLYHRLAPKLFGSLMAQFQNSDYNGGGVVDGVSEQYYSVGLGLEYKFNSNFSGKIGYSYDRLESVQQIENNRSFDRNRVYLGITASY